jgi:hypothetical protein
MLTLHVQLRSPDVSNNQESVIGTIYTHIPDGRVPSSYNFMLGTWTENSSNGNSNAYCKLNTEQNGSKSWCKKRSSSLVSKENNFCSTPIAKDGFSSPLAKTITHIF